MVVPPPPCASTVTTQVRSAPKVVQLYLRAKLEAKHELGEILGETPARVIHASRMHAHEAPTRL